jgi:L-alanine-DL-glutamate epimerase-like enolase superfamily enzyme
MKLSWRRITAHTKHAFKIARPGSSVSGGGKAVERTIVSIEHNGIVGMGEAAPTPFYHQTLDTVEVALAQMQPLLGDEPEDIEGIVARLLEKYDGDRAAVSAVDIALHDLWGKRTGKPIWQLYGYDRSKIQPTSMTIGIDDLALLPQKVSEASGFDILKIKIGMPNDVETLTALRKLAPHTKVRVDANCGWEPGQLTKRIREVSPFNLELIEQPTATHQFEALREARQMSPVPLVADEDSAKPADVEALAGVYDGINIKLSKCGGICEARKMIALARGLNMKIMLGCMVETTLGVSAAAQIASEVDYVDLDGHLLLADDPFTGLILDGGVVRPSDRPGLGVSEKSENL